MGVLEEALEPTRDDWLALQLNQILDRQAPVLADCIDLVLLSIKSDGGYQVDAPALSTFFAARAVSELARLGVREWLISGQNSTITFNQTFEFLAEAISKNEPKAMVSDAVEIWFALELSPPGKAYEVARAACEGQLEVEIQSGWEHDKDHFWYGGATIAHCLRWAYACRRNDLVKVCKTALQGARQDETLFGKRRLHAYHLGHVAAVTATAVDPEMKELHSTVLAELPEEAKRPLKSKNVHEDFRVASITASYLGLVNSSDEEHQRLAKRLGNWLKKKASRKLAPALSNRSTAVSALPALLTETSRRSLIVPGRFLVAPANESAAIGPGGLVWQVRTNRLEPDQLRGSGKSNLEQVLEYLFKNEGLSTQKNWPEFDPYWFTRAGMMASGIERTTVYKGVAAAREQKFIEVETMPVVDPATNSSRQRPVCLLTSKGESEAKKLLQGHSVAEG